MLEELKELLEMQRVLDEAILRESKHKYGKIIADQNRIALFVELGELMNEVETAFKHWKKKAKFDREKALIEYVDALHFALSLFNHYECRVTKDYEYNRHGYGCFEVVTCLTEIVKFPNVISGASLIYLFDLGRLLGFKWNEIYKAYKDKNAINYQRLRSGY